MNHALSLAATMETLASHNDVTLEEGWASFLGVAANTPELFTAMSVIYGRFLEARAQILAAPIGQKGKQLGADAAYNLSQFANPALCRNYRIQHLVQHRRDIDLLHVAGEALPHDAADEPPISIEDICSELENIRKAAKDAELSPEVRRVIEDSLNTLLMVLKGYQTFGPDGAARIYGSVLAELTRVYVQRPQSEAATSKPLLKRLMATSAKVMRAIALLGGLVHGIDQIATDGPQILALLADFSGLQDGEVESGQPGEIADNDASSSNGGMDTSEVA